MIQKKLNNNAKKIDKFLINYLKRQEKSLLINPMKYGVISGGKKIRSTIIFDVGKIFKINEKKLINICAAVECIHSYSLIHDDLPCMDNDSMRRGKPSTHIKFGEASAVLAGSSLLTLAFEIIADKKYLLNPKIKNEIIKMERDTPSIIELQKNDIKQLFINLDINMPNLLNTNNIWARIKVLETNCLETQAEL